MTCCLIIQLQYIFHLIAILISIQFSFFFTIIISVCGLMYYWLTTCQILSEYRIIHCFGMYFDSIYIFTVIILVIKLKLNKLVVSKKIGN